MLAELGTRVTEFGDLSRLTGDAKYVAAAKAAQKAVFDRRSALDLVGTSINIETGDRVDTTSTMNPPVDSFFEYLFEGVQFLGDRDDLRMYHTLITAFLRRQTVEINGRTWFTSADMDTGLTTSIEQSELASFAGGMLGQPGFLREGRAYERSWTEARRRGGYRSLPEGLDPATLGAASKGNQLRPEYVDSAFNLWLQTGNRLYVDLAAEYYAAQRATSRVTDASGALVGYTNPRRRHRAPRAPGRPHVGLLVLGDHEVTTS